MSRLPLLAAALLLLPSAPTRADWLQEDSPDLVAGAASPGAACEVARPPPPPWGDLAPRLHDLTQELLPDPQLFEDRDLPGLTGLQARAQRLLGGATARLEALEAWLAKAPCCGAPQNASGSGDSEAGPSELARHRARLLHHLRSASCRLAADELDGVRQELAGAHDEAEMLTDLVLQLEQWTQEGIRCTELIFPDAHPRPEATAPSCG